MRLPPKDAQCFACAHFTVRGHPELAAVGRGLCVAWFAPHVRDWHDGACGSYKLDSQHADARSAWAAEQAQK